MKRTLALSAFLSAFSSGVACAAPPTIVDDGVVGKTTTITGVHDKPSPLACNGKLDYVPWPALSAENYTAYIVENGTVKKEIREWPTSTDEVSKLLPNISTQVSKISGDAEVDVGLFGSAEWHSVKYAIDFMKYRSEAIEDSSGKVYSWGRVGAGMRLVVEIKTKEASVSGNLMAIAASAKAGKTTGSISADIIGLDAQDVTLAVPFTTDLSEPSIQKIVEALAVIKSKFGDTTTNIRPQFIARIECASEEKTKGATY